MRAREHPHAEVGDGDLTCRVVESIAEVPAATWDGLGDGANPFLRHAFLSALETNGCVGDDSGWLPRHLVLESGARTLGVMPAYLKLHSYGEFVFDWGWAEAYERNGLEYYPKLLCAVPFTPCTGPRLLAADAVDADAARRGLAAAAIQLTEQAELSSCHWLFTDERDSAVLASMPLVERWGCQYHWHSRDMRDFQDYLDALTSKRRKQVRKERREAAAAGLEVVALHGEELAERDLAAYHRLYCSTYDRKWGYPSLTRAFFFELAERMPRSLLLVLARRGQRVVAGAHLLAGTSTLYGRNWGCREHHRSLHFEVCYYQGIEYCLRHGLTRFEAGAQGEHKITRGFLPVVTRSFHCLRDARFRRAIEDFVARERAGVETHVREMSMHSPFREPVPSASARAL